ncbi:Receptor-like serine/threonine-protein kinase SD1-7 [Vitis vinifera]|uniref:Receptor-like serine/threonine-protein kinase n=1 Tax=Vitis vinifera TaxID=29760 RepID=A0A438G9S9_VITVI|nr:Receptor-like serine/threonine-protein kinase SD1-7 [Vitis vinifera]
MAIRLLMGCVFTGNLLMHLQIQSYKDSSRLETPQIIMWGYGTRKSQAKSQTKIVWVANREYAFKNPSVVLTVSTDGNLEILEEKFAYKSFDYPSHAFLPGMKIGYDKRAGKTWSLTSWKSTEDPSPGVFSLAHDPNGTSQNFLARVRKIKQMTWLESSHQWNLFWAQPRTQCEVYAYCGPFGICDDSAVDGFCECLPGFEPVSPNNWNSDEGCVRKADLQCGNTTHANGERDQFRQVSDVILPDYPLTLPARSAKECKSACLNNCSCSAYAYDRETCTVWSGDLLNLRKPSDYTSNGQDFYLKLAAPEPNGRVINSRNVSSKVEGVANCYTGHFPNFSLCHLGDMEKAPKKSSEDTTYELSEANKLWRGENKEVDLPMFSFTSVSAATNNFSIENKLGEGGFGLVYKGKSQKGYEVVVKRLSKRSGQGWEELKNEAMLIAKLQHKNLVKLFGCCIEQDEKILIYEYMPNKSLDFFLFNHAKHGILNWKTRVHIIEGVAQGLLYLHQYSRLRIIHRDLKASNILLDKDMNPKISYFGMARIFGSNESKATNHIVGTYGYMSPEYALEGLFSTKSDVFSFGVLLLEILSGKKNTGFYQSDSLNLLGYAWDLWKDSRGQELMDPVLEETLPRHILLKYINIGLLCVQESADDRPTMSDVVSMLGNESVRLPSPKQPAFSNLRSGVEPHIFQNRPEICSLNGVTLSIMEAR